MQTEKVTMNPQLQKFIKIKNLHKALAERGYVGKPLEKESMYLYTRKISKTLDETLIFSKNINFDCLGNCTLHVGSITTRAVSMSIGVDQPDVKVDEYNPEVTCVLVVNALWLRWNREPEKAPLYKNDYIFDKPGGIDRLITDVDSVVAEFVRSVSSERALADMLCDLESYPKQIRWGGKPRSSNPYIYAAILYAANAEKELALEALNKGERAYDSAASSEHWQQARFKRYTREMQAIQRWVADMG
ncbi:MAG: hypothetical protein ABUL58_01210 [Steroidobacter sp.]